MLGLSAAARGNLAALSRFAYIFSPHITHCSRRQRTVLQFKIDDISNRFFSFKSSLKLPSQESYSLDKNLHERVKNRLKSSGYPKTICIAVSVAMKKYEGCQAKIQDQRAEIAMQVVFDVLYKDAPLYIDPTKIKKTFNAPAERIFGEDFLPLKLADYLQLGYFHGEKGDKVSNILAETVIDELVIDFFLFQAQTESN